MSSTGPASWLRCGPAPLSMTPSVSMRASFAVFDRAAAWTARARGHGRYQGAAFDFDERSTDLWIYRDDCWACVLTQLTRIAPRTFN